MLRKLALMMALSPAMWLSTALALGLGEIDVKSALNQRFSASIPLTDLMPDEAETLQVELAQSEAFDRAGLERSDYLSTLSFVVKTDDGAPRIVISSRQIAREPYFSLLLDVRSHSGRIQRQFTILLDPPDYALTKQAPVTAPAADVPAETAPASPPKAQKKTPEASALTGASALAEYGPVAAGETLWSIAARLRKTPDITMDQMQLALYKSNPQAFENGRITKMLKGAMLKVPSEKLIKSVSPEAAKSRILQLRAGKPKTDAVPQPRPKKPDVSQPAENAKTTGPAATPSEAPPAPPSAPAAPSTTVKPAPAPAAKTEGSTAALVKPDPAASGVAAATPAASAVEAGTPVSGVTATTPSTVVGRVPLISETASAPAATTASAETPASAVTSESVSSVPAQAIEPVKPYIPPPIPPAPEPSPLIEEFEGPIKLAGGVLVIAGLLGGWLYSRRKAASKPEKIAPKGGAGKTLNWQFWKKKDAPATSQNNKKPSAPVITPPPAAFDELQFERDYEATQQSTQRSGNNKFSPEAQKKEPAPAPLPDVEHLPNFDSTQMFDAPHDAPLPGISPDAVDFDVTGRFEAETLKIDLNNNDPLAEADFHLAYGLFDEAALQLKQAAQKEPARTDIPAKLAEVYFRAGKAADFQAVAETLKPKLTPSEWTKIALMGKQLSPDAPLYQGIDDSALVTEVDMAFDEPASPQIPEPAAPAAAVNFELSSREAPKAEVAKPAADAGNMLEFNLDDFKFDAPAADAAAKPEPQAPARDKAEAPLEFDLSSFDLGSADAGTPEAGLPGVDEIKLDDFDLSMPDDSNAISTGDEASTKLDLARAYVDMGDNDMARSLLNEVLQQGSAGQKTEAQALLGRLA